MNLEIAKEKLDISFRLPADFANKTVKNLRIPTNSKILDIGTGMGWMAIILALNGYQVLTGEPKETNDDYEKGDWYSNCQNVGLDDLITYQHFNAIDLPFENNTFGGIFILSTLHHIHEADHVKVLQECIRVGKSNGNICIFEPNDNGMKFIIEKIPSHPDPVNPEKIISQLSLECEKIKGPFFDAYVVRID